MRHCAAQRSPQHYETGSLGHPAQPQGAEGAEVENGIRIPKIRSARRRCRLVDVPSERAPSGTHAWDRHVGTRGHAARHQRTQDIPVAVLHVIENERVLWQRRGSVWAEPRSRPVHRLCGSRAILEALVTQKPVLQQLGRHDGGPRAVPRVGARRALRAAEALRPSALRAAPRQPPAAACRLQAALQRARPRRRGAAWTPRGWRDARDHLQLGEDLVQHGPRVATPEMPLDQVEATPPEPVPEVGVGREALDLHAVLVHAVGLEDVLFVLHAHALGRSPAADDGQAIEQRLAQFALHAGPDPDRPKEELRPHVELRQLLVGHVQVERDERVPPRLVEQLANEGLALLGARPHEVHEPRREHAARCGAEDLAHDELRRVEVGRVAHAPDEEAALPALQRGAPLPVRLRVDVGQDPDLVGTHHLGRDRVLVGADH
mmetsp:Transcript_49501/g.141472  ORF Transcript_49501/g.141472 Transcript_49501/m.141472 type:complete len:433 (-) Transcript_49501:181-1479(-)